MKPILLLAAALVSIVLTGCPPAPDIVQTTQKKCDALLETAAQRKLTTDIKPLWEKSWKLQSLETKAGDTIIPWLTQNNIQIKKQYSFTGSKVQRTTGANSYTLYGGTVRVESLQDGAIWEGTWRVYLNGYLVPEYSKDGGCQVYMNVFLIEEIQSSPNRPLSKPVSIMYYVSAVTNDKLIIATTDGVPALSKPQTYIPF